MADLAKTATRVTFSSESDTSVIFTFEINEELNNNKSSFLQGEPVYINLFRVLDVNNVGSTNGNVTLYKTKQKKTIKEVLYFTNSRTVDVNYPVDQSGNIDFIWYGNSLGNISVINNSTIKANKSGYGVGIISYTTLYDIYKLTTPKDIPNNEERGIIVFGSDIGGNTAYINISVQGNKLSEQDIIIESKDYDLDLAIPGAEVYIDGEFKGLTDGYGKLNVGKLPIGKYSLKIVASGYKTTDQDALNNDFFIVE